MSILELQLQQLSQASSEPLHGESPQLLETMTSMLASETVDTTTTGRTSGCRTTRGKDISSYSSLIPKSRDKTTSSTVSISNDEFGITLDSQHEVTTSSTKSDTVWIWF